VSFRTVSRFTVAESVVLKDSDGRMRVGGVPVASDARHVPLSAASITRRDAPRVVRGGQGGDVEGGRPERLRCAPLIAVMETTDFSDRDDRSNGCSETGR
jgi:endonuclease V-like protein UPF0215 family